MCRQCVHFLEAEMCTTGSVVSCCAATHTTQSHTRWSSRDSLVCAARPQPRNKSHPATEGAPADEAHSDPYAGFEDEWEGESSEAEETTCHQVNFVGGRSSATHTFRPWPRNGYTMLRHSIRPAHKTFDGVMDTSCNFFPGMEPAVGVPVEPGVTRTDVDFDSLMTMLRPQPTGKL